jgi:hypothetical protein
MTKERNRGDWLQTYTGRAWWPMDPSPEDVCIEDIAHGLAYQCRYNGHCREFYSVAEHSTRVAAQLYKLGPAEALAGLLHDAAEAYLGDIVRPVKRQLPRFYELERLNLIAIFEGLGVPITPEAFCDEVAEADLVLLATERRDLMGTPPRPWVSIEKVEPLGGAIKPMTPSEAESFFIDKYIALRSVVRVA